jgi:hypothetical protein
MMNQQQEILVLCIGLGVGVAAVIGTLRFICDWCAGGHMRDLYMPACLCRCVLVCAGSGQSLFVCA